MGTWLIPGINSGFFEKIVNVTNFAKIEPCGTPQKWSRLISVFLKIIYQ